MTDETPAGMGLMLTDDLIFFSRVSATARAKGAAIHQVRTHEALVQAAKQAAPATVILDLHNETLDLPKLLAELRAAGPVMPRTVAYGSHVEAAVLAAAREAGCDLVLPRSKFVKVLETELEKWLAPRDSESH